MERLAAALDDDRRGPLEPLTGAMEWAAAGVELLSIAILMIGALRFAAAVTAGEFLRDGARRRRSLDAARLELGRYILAGLELLIVSDVIYTALRFALADILFLGALVLVRSLISWLLSHEIEAMERHERGRGET